MKVCVVGNSHVAAIRSAWAEGSSPLTAHHVDFFAVARGDPAVAAGHLVVSGAATVHSTVGDRLDLSAYDAILVSAVGNFAVRNQHPHPLLAMALPQWHCTLPKVSASVFRRCVRHGLGEFAWVSLALQIAEAARGRTYLQPWPLPAPDVAADPDWKLGKLHGSGVAGVLSTYFKVQDEELRDMLGSRGEVLPYPRQEWLDGGFTPAEFGTRDPWHMNAAYGRIVLQQLADRLAPTDPR